jgi:hypothetical protein
VTLCRTTLSQLVGLIASEPPSAADADGLRDKRVEVFRAIPPADVTRYVRGQYNGYLSAPGVSPGSQTETFAALRLEIDNWRWAGVPFFIRAGKALAARATEVRIIFKPPPRLAFARHTPHPGEFILRIDPYPGADLMGQAKQPGAESTRTVDLSLTFSEELGMRRSPTSGFWVTPCGGMPCSSPGRTAWSRRGALCNPCWTRRPGWSPTPRDPGGRPAQRRCLPGTRVGATPGYIRTQCAEAICPAPQDNIFMSRGTRGRFHDGSIGMRWLASTASSSGPS